MKNLYLVMNPHAPGVEVVEELTEGMLVVTTKSELFEVYLNNFEAGDRTLGETLMALATFILNDRLFGGYPDILPDNIPKSSKFLLPLPKLPSFLTADQLAFLLRPVADLGAGRGWRRVDNCLRATGMIYVWQMAFFDFDYLRRLRNFGAGALTMFKGILKSGLGDDFEEILKKLTDHFTVIMTVKADDLLEFRRVFHYYQVLSFIENGHELTLRDFYFYDYKTFKSLAIDKSESGVKMLFNSLDELEKQITKILANILKL